jgi:hypothetical protein
LRVSRYPGHGGLCSTHRARTSLKLPNVTANRTSRWNWVFLALKELMMTPSFLREEAARFRGMAGTADLEASKTRLLAMAIDFESRATAADELITPKLDEGIKDRAAKKTTKDLHHSV